MTARTVDVDPASTPQFDPVELRRTLALFPTGLVVVAAHDENGPAGLIASSFTSVSLDPPIVSVNIGHGSSTLPRLQQCPYWGISVLSADQHHVGAAFRKPTAERFADLAWRTTRSGAVHLDGAVATFSGELGRLIPVGDHDIALLTVADFTAEPDSPPLVFHRSTFRQVADHPATVPPR